MEGKVVGLLLACMSSVLIGSSFILTKKGLMQTAGGGAQAYLQNRLWWMGLITMVCGEIANFAAYGFAQAILVAPLGALSVIISSVLASMFLQDELGFEGKIGCALSLLGSLIIVLNAPQDQDISSIDEIMDKATQPGFMIYCILAAGTILYFIYRLAEPYGRRTPVVYITICSLAGSITVTAAKALTIALRLTFEGNNQFSHIATYFFILVTVGCILMQMNYFNKALDSFSTAIVTPIYYVFFTTATIVASVILQQGIYDSEVPTVLTLLIGFLIIFMGVWLINKHKVVNERNAQSRRNSLLNGIPAASSNNYEMPMMMSSNNNNSNAGRLDQSHANDLHSGIRTTIFENNYSGSDRESASGSSMPDSPVSGDPLNARNGARDLASLNGLPGDKRIVF